MTALRGVIYLSVQEAARVVRQARHWMWNETFASGCQYTTQVHDPGEVITEYHDPRRDSWRSIVLPALRDRPVKEIAEAAGLDPSSVKRIRAGRSVPRPEHQTSLIALAGTVAREAREEWGISTPVDGLVCCYAHLVERKVRVPKRTCEICGTQLTRQRFRYCSSACKQRAYRHRKHLRYTETFPPELPKSRI